MQLEPKHIIPYSLFGLQVIHSEYDRFDITSDVMCVSNNYVSFDIGCDYYFNDEEPECEIKPLLRPLSQLTEEIEHNGERFVPMDIFSLMYFGGQANKEALKKDFYENIIYTRYNSLSYETVQKLIEWHFDVFGLIPAGLAVPKPAKPEATEADYSC